jgi:nitrate reductase gamma subunit
MYNFIGGQLVFLAFVVFVLGLLYHTIRFFQLTRKKEWVLPPVSGMEKPAKKTAGQIVVGSLKSLKGTFWKTDPVMMTMTSVFHVCLFLVPIFLPAHNILLDQSWGVSLWGLPEFFADGLTAVVLICVAFFILRRLFLARVRAISSFYDYVVLLIVVAPFLTGFLAYHQWFDYRTMMILHVLTAELMLIVVPFTKLGHMLFFFLYRFFIGSEYSFTRGSRTW